MWARQSRRRPVLQRLWRAPRRGAARSRAARLHPAAPGRDRSSHRPCRPAPGGARTRYAPARCAPARPVRRRPRRRGDSRAPATDPRRARGWQRHRGSSSTTSTDLPDGGAGLLLGEIGGAFLEPEAPHAESDGARGDHEDVVAFGAQGGDLRADGVDSRCIELTNTGGQDAGAELDDGALAGGFAHGRGKHNATEAESSEGRHPGRRRVGGKAVPQYFDAYAVSIQSSSRWLPATNTSRACCALASRSAGDSA